MARVVVVGGGLAGTACAARLAKLGHQVTLVERLARLGGAVGFVEQDGFRWDTGPTSTLLPAVLRDLFRKSGRQLERELKLVPAAREHRFADKTALVLPTGSRTAVREAVDDALGNGRGQRWVDYVDSFADVWGVLRQEQFERPFSPEALGAEARRLLGSRVSLRKRVAKALRDERLRGLALFPAVLDGHDPRNVPAWVGLLSYLEQSFGLWTVPGGFGLLAEAMSRRLAERKVMVLTETTARDIVMTGTGPAAVETDQGPVDAEMVVCAADPRRLPALARFVAATMPALPPSVTHVGLVGEVPEVAHEIVVHGDATLVVRTDGTAPAGAAAWTLLARGKLSEDPLIALARAGLKVRDLVEVRRDVSVREQVETWRGSPYGTLWQGRATVTDRLSTRTPLPGVYAAGAAVAGAGGVPFVGLTAAVVAEQIGPG